MLRSSQVSPRSRFVVFQRIKIIQICPIVQVASWGIIKMNDYLVSGTRQQYWEEFFVKHVMSVSLFFFLHLSSATEGHLKPNVAATFFFEEHQLSVVSKCQTHMVQSKSRLKYEEKII